MKKVRGEARGLGKNGIWCKILPCLSKILQEGRRKKTKASSAREFEVRTKPYISLNDVWVRKTIIHSWVLLMVGLG